MTLGRHALMICLFTLIVFSWNQPASVLGWGPPRLAERSYDMNNGYTGSGYNYHVQHKVPPYRQNYYSDYGHSSPENDRNAPSGVSSSQREQEETYYVHHHHHHHHHHSEENQETLSRRIYDGGYVNNGPQNLGDAEEGKTGIRQTYRSSHVKFINNLREKRRISKKKIKRRKRDEDVEKWETTPETEAFNVNTEETATENAHVSQDEVRAFTRPEQGGSHNSKRPNSGHEVKGYNSHRRPTKPKTTPSPKRNSTLNADFHDSKLVFPDTPLFRPMNTLCAGENTFCEDTDDYPKTYIRELLQKEGQKFGAVFGQDTILSKDGSSVSSRIFSNPNETDLCASIQRVIFPTKAKNKDQKWQFVINQDGYTQGIGVETCLNAGKPCEMRGFPNGYETVCKQKYITRRLLSLNENGGPGMSEFLFPSCCVCVLQFVTPGVSSKLKS